MAFPGGENAYAENVQAYDSTYHKMDCKNVPRSVPPWTFAWQRGKMVGCRVCICIELKMLRMEMFFKEIKMFYRDCSQT